MILLDIIKIKVRLLFSKVGRTIISEPTLLEAWVSLQSRVCTIEQALVIIARAKRDHGDSESLNEVERTLVGMLGDAEGGRDSFASRVQERRAL
jgi:hypothetical protein